MQDYLRSSPREASIVEWARMVATRGGTGPEPARACLSAALWAERHDDVATAEELVTYALDLPSHDLQTQVGLMRLLGRCHARAGRRGPALDLLDRAAQLARTHLDPVAQAEVSADTAEADLSLTRVRAGRAADLAAALAAPGLDDPLRARLSALLAAAVAFADPSRADLLLRRAVRLSRGSRAARTWTLIAEIRELLGAGPQEPGVEPAAPKSSAAAVLGPVLRRDGAEQLAATLERLEHPGLGVRDRAVLDVVRLGQAVNALDGAAVEALLGRLAATGCHDVAAMVAAARLSWALQTGTDARLPAEIVAIAPPGSSLATLFIVGPAVIGVHQGLPGALTRLAGLAGMTGLGGMTGPGGPAGFGGRRGLNSSSACDPAGVSVLAMHAAAAAALGDRSLCRLALHRLGQLEGGAATVMLGVIGPVGWFTAWAHRAMGELPAALNANDLAAAHSSRTGARGWQLQCALQRAEILAQEDPPESARLLADAGRLARAHGLEALLRTAPHAQNEQAQGEPSGTGSRSGRWEQVLALAAEGLTNEQIAQRLAIASSTVERHLTVAYRTLGVRNRAEAVNAAGAVNGFVARAVNGAGNGVGNGAGAGSGARSVAGHADRHRVTP